MDVVITYVNGLDPEWLASYERTVGHAMNRKYFRDWGTLRYLLRGIDRYMPYVRRVHLFVAMESQVPDWIDRERVHVVLHRDIVPEKYLPLFNAGSIEMFLPLIPDLDEEFLYFNDDFFPLRPSHPEDFFRGGRIRTGFSSHLNAWNIYKKHVRSSDRAARRLSGLRPSRAFRRPQHICSPMLRSVCLSLFEQAREEIFASITPLRSPQNFNQYLYMNYMYYTGHAENHRICRKFFSMARDPMGRICRYMRAPRADFICINDVNMSEERYRRSRRMLQETFEEILPERSHYERETIGQ